MQLPVWVTVIIARFVGGFAVGFVAGVVYVASSGSTNGALGQSSTLTVTLVITLVGAVVTGAVTVALLPPLSGCRVTIGNAVLATVVGQLIPFVGGLLVSHAVTRDTSSSMYLPLYGTAGPLLSLGLTVAGIAATAWMIQSTTMAGSGAGPRYELYGKARRESLDDEY
ncbi:MAG: hypothetical protein ABJB93_11030 [Gaiellales bacterium]